MQPTWFPTPSPPPLPSFFFFFQWFETTAALLPSLPLSNSLFSYCRPRFSLLCFFFVFFSFWSGGGGLKCCITKDGVLKRCLLLPRLSPCFLSHSPCSPGTDYQKQCQSFFTPAASGGGGGGWGGGGWEELELALMLASGLWSTQLRGIRSTVHLAAALQWNNIPWPTNLHLSSSPLCLGRCFTRNLVKLQMKP